MKNQILILSLLMAFLANFLPAGAAEKEWEVLQESKPLVFQKTGKQQFSSFINLTPGQEKMPLTLTFYNGSDKARGFSWMRISIAGEELLTEKNFKGGRTCVTNVTGMLGPGRSQVLVNAGGYQGATMFWVLTTAKVKTGKIKPDAVYPGEIVNISGKNFSPNAQENKVSFNGVAGKVERSTNYALRVQVPKNAKPGRNKVAVEVRGKKISSDLTVKIKPPPELTRLSLIAGSPGTSLTILGRNFERELAKNRVYIGGVPASVTGGGTNSLTVTIPLALDAVNPSFGQPVVVTVANGKVKSNALSLNIQMRVIPMPEGTDAQPPWQSPYGPRIIPTPFGEHTTPFAEDGMVD